MPKQDDGLIYWRTLATVEGAGSSAGTVKLRVHGWDLSRGPLTIPLSEIPSSAGIIKLGVSVFVHVAEDAQGFLHLKDWEQAPEPIDESELLHTP
jgi:hypothetical protein